MLDQLINSIKGQLTNQVNNETGLDLDQTDLACAITGQCIRENVNQSYQSNNFDAITQIFGGGSNYGGGNPMMNSLSQNIVNNLGQKLGLSPAIAGTVANIVTPMILSKLGGEMNKQNVNTQDAGSIMNFLNGNSSSEPVKGAAGASKGHSGNRSKAVD